MSAIKVLLWMFIGLAGLCWFIWDGSAWNLGTEFPRFVERAQFPFLFIVVPICLVAAAAYAIWNRIGNWGVSFAIVAAIVILGVGFKPAWQSEWRVYRDYGSAVTESKKLPDWQMRVNRPQARIDIQRSLGDTRGKLGDPTYIPDAPGGPAWCATITAEATIDRVWTTAVACLPDLKGRKTQIAKFPAATVGSWDGEWSSNLRNQVVEEERGLHFREQDAYGYIDKDGKPHLIAPVTRLSGSITTIHEVPAGVVEFGPDGTAKYRPNVERVGIPGPVMPMLIAENIRAGLNARDGLVSYDKPNRNKNAYQSTSDGDVSDPNSDNPTEFVLRRCDPGSAPADRPADSTTTVDDCKNPRVVYVTPLTPYGTGRNVTAYLEVEADVVHDGKLPKATLYRLPEPQAATGTIAQTIASLYDADLSWATDNNGGASNNLARLFELTPTGPDSLVATIGVGSKSIYRLYIDPTSDDNGTFGQMCIHSFADDKKIRCDSADAQPLPVGSIRGIAQSGDGTDPESPTTPIPADPNAPATPLDQVSTADLIAELNRRAQNGGL